MQGFILGCLIIIGKMINEIDDKTNQTLGKLQPGNYANLKLKKKYINCPILFRSKVHDLPAPPFMTKPLQYIPGSLISDYTYDGRIKVLPWYISENFPTNHKGIYTFYYPSYIMFDTIKARQ